MKTAGFHRNPPLRVPHTVRATRLGPPLAEAETGASARVPPFRFRRTGAPGYEAQPFELVLDS